MLDLKLIRQEPERVRAAIAAKGMTVDLDRLLALDAERRDLLGEVEALKHERNQVSREVGTLKREGRDPGDRLERMRRVGEAIDALDARERALSAAIDDLLAWVPNLPHGSVPGGSSAADNIVVRVEGEPPAAGGKPRDHIELGETLGILDFERAAKLSGSGFIVLRGQGARLERALISYMLDLHTTRHGYEEVWTPVLARPECLFGTGQLPKLREDMYYLATDDAFLIPTAEVTITSLYAGETLHEETLPLKHAGYTACFRREAGSAGRETRGLLRVHQFDKVELVKFAHPDRSYDEHQSLLADAEAVLSGLGLHYRVVELCTADLSFAAAKCYDLEVWAAGEGRWLEVSSCSNFEDFQARRLGIRMRPADGGRTRFVHTLNASGVALPRLVVALLEHYQTPEGSVRLPAAIRPYMGDREEIAPPAPVAAAHRH